MLLQKLHDAYTQFSDYCNGKQVDWNITFEEIVFRLNTFNNLNKDLIEAEAKFHFENQEKEISYFKIEKPEFQKYGILYQMMYEIELRKRPIHIKYYKKQLKRLDKEFTELEPFVIYYRSNSIEKDSEYFSKSSKQNHIIGLIKANEMLVEYLAHKSGGKTADEIIASAPKVKFNRAILV